MSRDTLVAEMIFKYLTNQEQRKTPRALGSNFSVVKSYRACMWEGQAGMRKGGDAQGQSCFLSEVEIFQ
jgi:hypothetical protein